VPQAQVRHLHTYFLFPFSVDKEAVLQDHPEFWPGRRTWFDGIDAWMEESARRDKPPVAEKLGPWLRSAYTRFDTESEAYQTMVFFHPFVRRVFFDAWDPSAGQSRAESLLNCYSIPLSGRDVLLEATDLHGRRAEVRITDLRLFLFANAIGILSIGVEASNLTAADALWINEMMRKVYPSSGRQLREGRTPNLVRIFLRQDGVEEVVVEENFRGGGGGLRNFNPRLASHITGLLYFVDYAKHEYSAVLDERMLVYTYAAVESESKLLPVLISRFLYVDRYGEEFRYNPKFLRQYMKRHLYMRWAHQGTYYGCTTYSNITLTTGTFNCDDHSLQEGFLIERQFDSRYYLMCIIALFYRATLLDFAERAALVSRRLYLDEAEGRLSPEGIWLANRLRGDFLHFTNYWLFDELANKDEEMEHFLLQQRVYRLNTMRVALEEEIEKLNGSLHEYYQNQNSQAVNRLAVVSMVLGAGAVMTGYFGMNFEREFRAWIFDPGAQAGSFIHYSLIGIVTLFAIAALVFALYLIAANWSDYRQILIPGARRRGVLESLRRDGHKAAPENHAWIIRRRNTGRPQVRKKEKPQDP